MAVPYQWMSHINGCPISMDVPYQWMSHINGCPISMDVPYQWMSKKIKGKKAVLTAGGMETQKYCTQKKKKKTLGSAILWLLAFPGESSPTFPCNALGQKKVDENTAHRRKNPTTLGSAVLWLLAFPGESCPTFPCNALGQKKVHENTAHRRTKQQPWVAPYYGCSLSPEKAARLSRALHWDKKKSHLIESIQPIAADRWTAGLSGQRRMLLLI